MNTKYFFLMAAQQKSGQTTIAYNLGAAMRTQGKSVLIVSLFENERLANWNKTDEKASVSAVKQVVYGNETFPDHLIWPMGDFTSFPELFQTISVLQYDVVWLLCGQPSEDCLRTFSAFPVLPQDDVQFLLCTTLESRQDAQIIRPFLKMFADILHREIDWIIPNKLKVREWESNSQQLMDLGEWFGYERIVDMLPECSRIHELSLDHKTVWEVPVDQIRFAFTKLLKLLEN